MSDDFIMSVNKDVILKQFGQLIRNKREALGLSQEELADKANLHRTYIGDIERGERNVSLLNIRKISAALNIPISELLAGFESLIDKK